MPATDYSFTSKWMSVKNMPCLSSNRTIITKPTKAGTPCTWNIWSGSSILNFLHTSDVPTNINPPKAPKITQIHIL